MAMIIFTAPNGKQVSFEAGDMSKAEIDATIELISARNMPPTDPTRGMTTGQKLLAGIGRGMVNVPRQIGNILGMVPDEELERIGELEAPLMATTPGQIGSVVGEVATTAPLAGGLVAGGARTLGAAAPALRTTAAARPVTAGAATGAAEGAIEGAIVGGPGERLSGAATGAGFGAAGGSLLPLLLRGFRTPSPEAQTLIDLGVDLTPGQMKPGSAFGQYEQALQSMGVIGPAVRASRERAQREFSQGMMQRVRPPDMPELITDDAESMLDQAFEQYRTAYDRLKGFDVDPGVQDRVGQAFEDAAYPIESAVDAAKSEAVERYLNNQLTRLSGPVDTDDLIKMRSKIRREVRKNKTAVNPDFEKAEMLEDAEAAITAEINRALPEELIEYGRNVDRAYSRYKIAENALYRKGDRDFPTPFQWSQAVKNATERGRYARGGGQMREEIAAAAEAFKVTDPSTGARLATMGTYGVPIGAGFGLVGGQLDPVTSSVAAGTAGLLAATKPGRLFSTGNLALQRGLQEAVEETPELFRLPGIYARSILPVAATGE